MRLMWFTRSEPPLRIRMPSRALPTQTLPTGSTRTYAASMTKRASSHTGRAMTAREQMILQTLRYALRVKSDADLPKVFQLPVALKPGSWEELAARFNVPRDESDPRRRALGSIMAMYCRSRQYGHALLTCDQFFSIDMEPSEPPESADREPGRALTGQSSSKGASRATQDHGNGQSRDRACARTRSG